MGLSFRLDENAGRITLVFLFSCFSRARTRITTLTPLFSIIIDPTELVKNSIGRPIDWNTVPLLVTYNGTGSPPPSPPLSTQTRPLPFLPPSPPLPPPPPDSAPPPPPTASPPPLPRTRLVEYRTTLFHSDCLEIYRVGYPYPYRLPDFTPGQRENGRNGNGLSGATGVTLAIRTAGEESKREERKEEEVESEMEISSGDEA